jgi:hypothetical protein
MQTQVGEATLTGLSFALSSYCLTHTFFYCFEVDDSQPLQEAYSTRLTFNSSIFDPP